MRFRCDCSCLMSGINCYDFRFKRQQVEIVIGEIPSKSISIFIAREFNAACKTIRRDFQPFFTPGKRKPCLGKGQHIFFCNKRICRRRFIVLKTRVMYGGIQNTRPPHGAKIVHRRQKHRPSSRYCSRYPPFTYRLVPADVKHTQIKFAAPILPGIVDRPYIDAVRHLNVYHSRRENPVYRIIRQRVLAIVIIK